MKTSKTKRGMNVEWHPVDVVLKTSKTKSNHHGSPPD